MVETKNIFASYDELNPPLVQATFADDTETRSVQDRDFVGGPASYASHSSTSQTAQTMNSSPPTYSQAVGTSLRNQDNNDNDHSNNTNDSRMAASGAAGAVLGFLFGGPLFAILCGFGSAYATTKDGAPGDAARALGDVAITAKTKAEEIDKEHNVVYRSKQAAAEMWENAKEYDRRHNILDQAKQFAVFSWKSFVKFVQDHRVLERGVDGVGKGFEYVAGRVVGDDANNQTAPSPQNYADQRTN